MTRNLSAFALLSVIPLSPLVTHAEDVFVQVRSSVVRSQPEHFAPGLRPVKYGDRLNKKDEDGGWVTVALDNGKTGYIPVSAVTAKTVVLSARQASKTAADPNEVVLAGKGFSKEVEERFRATDRSVRYDLVDQVERSGQVSDKEVAQFIKEGGLHG